MKKSLIDIFNKIDNNEKLTDYEIKKYINYSLTNHGGKMTGIRSCSTSCICNEYCKNRMKNKKLVCAECYSKTLHEIQTLNFPDKMKRNTVFYSNYKLTKNSIPFINESVFRFESFGDISNELHFQNYCTIAAANKATFVLWTKNIKIIKSYIDQGGKIPKNLLIIYSIPKMNFIPTMKFYRKLKKVYPFIKKLFCVFTNDFIQENNIPINCGGKYCLDCMTCYDPGNRTIFIYEKKK